MIYSNLEYVLFFGVNLAAFVLLPSYRVRFALLLVASFVFYYSTGTVSLLNLVFGIGVPWWITRQKGRGLGLGIVLLCLNLVFWKYASWVGAMFGKAWAIPLPAGISFVTLQSIAFLIDYRNRQTEHYSLPKYGLFLSFFPHVIAGPICRAHQLIPQILKLRSPTFADFQIGASWFLLGFAKKTILADRLAPIVDAVFARPSLYSREGLVLGVLGYAVQIWADFSGYTDMGRGSAKMLGIELPQNFLSPYLSKTPSEFWSRWHITLSTWIRDYVFNPLALKAYRLDRGATPALLGALALTMMLSGLWHGAGWNFLLWGLFHGVLLVVEKILAGSPMHAWGRKWVPSRIYSFAQWGLMFGAILVSWVLFRATSLQNISDYFGATVSGSGMMDLRQAKTVLVCAAICFVLQRFGYAPLTRQPKERLVLKIRTPRQALAWGVGFGIAMLALIYYRFSGQSDAFIYFQF